MLKKTITYTDYDGTTRKEDFYFNLNKSELMRLDLTTEGGVEKLIKKMIAERDNKKIFEMFEKIILMSYGEKSLDGRRFIKSEELSREFTQTEAYNVLLLELTENEKTMADFINGVLPSDLIAKAEDVDKIKEEVGLK